MLPQLESSLRELQALHTELSDCERELNETHTRIAGNGHLPLDDLASLPERAADLSRRLSERGRDVAESGVIIKDLDMGLLDFPTLREGHEVYLCWRLGEERIGWWHEVDAGLSGRQPLDDDD
jgi:hypothetical protein